MAKDPAFLFYFRDFLVSTELMTAEEIGCYIRILCHMADKGRLTIDDMQSICKAYGIAQRLHSKFKIDANGLFYNQKLEDEIEKRSNYTQSRRNNAKHMHKHMGNGNTIANASENAFEIIKTSIPNRAMAFNFEDIWSKYPRRVGKKAASKHFNASVRSEKDFDDIHIALEHYLASERVFNGFTQNGSTWFNSWRDWITYQEPVCPKCKNKGKYLSETGYESVCSCAKGKSLKINKT